MLLTKIQVNELREPRQVSRSVIDGAALEELTEDVRRLGVLVPLHVMEVDGGYEVIAGHRRLLAARRAGVVAVPCLVRTARDVDPLTLKMRENLYREEWAPVQEAAFFSELLTQCDNDVDKLCKVVKQSRAYVEGRLLLLSGDPDVLAAVAQKQITLGVAEELNKMTRPEDRRYYLKWTIAQGATRSLVRQWRASVNAQAPAAPQPDPASAGPVAAPVNPVDIFICALCKQKEPITDLRPVHTHQFCQIQYDVEVQRQAAAAGKAKAGGDDGGSG